MRQALDRAGHKVHLAVPISAIIFSIIGQVLFTTYFSDVHLAPLLVCVVGIFVLMLGELYWPNASKQVMVAKYVLLHTIAIVMALFLLPMPSPYYIYIILIAMFVYFDLGISAMIGSLAIIFAAILYRAHIETHYSLLNQDGSVLVFLIGIAVMTYYTITFVRVAQQEIADVQKSTAKALQHRQQVDSLINNITDGVIAIDKHHKVTTYNGAALDVLDLNTNIKGRLLSRIFKPIDPESQPVSIAKLLKDTTAPTINRDLRIKYNDGSTSNLFLAIAPIYLGYGKSENNGYTMLLRDITREKSLEEERDEFISVVSHELRTPIAITEGNISNAEFIVEKTGDISAVKKALSESHRQVLFLADMINDLSTLSRAERGVLEVEAEPIDVQALCSELQSNYTASAEAKGLTLKVDVDTKLQQLNSSKLYVREILQNYITNAIKYTEKGSVTIIARPAEKGVNFSIKDTGIGISKADQDRVFDKFFRSEDFRTRQSNGTGLGLYVTMKLQRLIHAEVSIESELNKGSTFTIFIPNFGD